MNSRNPYMSLLLGFTMIAAGICLKSWWGALGVLTVWNAVREIHYPAFARIRK